MNLFQMIIQSDYSSNIVCAVEKENIFGTAAEKSDKTTDYASNIVCAVEKENILFGTQK